MMMKALVLAMFLGCSSTALASDEELAEAIAALTAQLEEQQAEQRREQRWDDTFQALQSLQGIGRPVGQAPSSTYCQPFGSGVHCSTFP